MIGTDVATRYASAMSWWIAAELVRRYPKLRIGQAIDPVLGEVLTVRRRGRGQWTAVFSEGRGLDLLGFEESHHLTWAEMMTESNPHAVVKTIQGRTNWGFLPRSPATSHATIGVRVIAEIMNLVVNDRAQWRVENAMPERYGLGDSVSFEFTEFPTAGDEAMGDFKAYFPDMSWLSDYWTITSDGHQLCVIDPRGVIHIGSAGYDLMEEYDEQRRDMRATAASLLLQLTRGPATEARDTSSIEM